MTATLTPLVLVAFGLGVLAGAWVLGVWIAYRQRQGRLEQWDREHWQ